MKSEVIVDGHRYVPETKPPGEKLRLVICDNRGLTFAGWCDLDQLNERIRIRKARCVIRWGTTKHLSELAMHGPNETTQLGEQADVWVWRKNLIADYELDEDQWQ